VKKYRWVLWVVVLVLVVAVGLYPGTRDKVSDLFISKTQYDGHSISYWMKELDNPDNDVRNHAIHALGGLGPDAAEAVPALSKIMLESPSRENRIEASLALTKMTAVAQSAVPALAKALEDKELWVRMNAACALSYLGAESRPAIPELLKALPDKTHQTNLRTFPFTIQDQVALALARATAGTDEGVPALMAALKEFLNDHRNVVIKTVQNGQRSRKEDPKADEEATMVNTVIRTKMAFARAFGEVGPKAKAAVPLLKQMEKEDQISDFKQAAEDAIEKIEGKSVTAK
jgi:HEAT repeat protein